jgi:hypothetical protein
MDVLKELRQRVNSPKFGADNPFLNFSVYILEARKAGIEVSEMKEEWEKFAHDRRYKRGVFKRWPAQNGIWNPKSISHDEVIGGIVPMSYLFDGGQTVQEIIDHGLTFGLYFSGKWTKKWWHPDTEWFIYWRPEFRAFMKLAIGKELSWLEKWAMKLNIMVSGDHNMRRQKLLFLELVRFDIRWVRSQMRDSSSHLKQYHARNDLLNEIWKNGIKGI